MEHPFGCLHAVRASATSFAFATRRFTFAVEFRPNVNRVDGALTIIIRTWRRSQW